jgi:hypothetical protein
MSRWETFSTLLRTILGYSLRVSLSHGTGNLKILAKIYESQVAKKKKGINYTIEIDTVQTT